MKFSHATLIALAAVSTASPLAELMDKRSYCAGLQQTNMEKREVPCPPQARDGEIIKRHGGSCWAFEWNSAVAARDVACPPEARDGDIVKRHGGSCWMFFWNSRLDARDMECPLEEAESLVKRSVCNMQWETKLAEREAECPAEEAEIDVSKLHRRSYCTGLWQSNMKREVPCPPV